MLPDKVTVKVYGTEDPEATNPVALTRRLRAKEAFAVKLRKSAKEIIKNAAEKKKSGPPPLLLLLLLLLLAWATLAWSCPVS